MAWFRKAKKPKRPAERSLSIPEGVWVKCPSCKEIIYRKEVIRNDWVCPKCAHHFPLGVDRRIASLVDPGSFEEFDRGLASVDPLRFRDRKAYRARLEEYRKKTGLADAVVTGTATIDAVPIVLAAMAYEFMGGSMGSVVGEKITRSIERAIDEQRGLVIVSASGGARMQEGALSLMQMAKICAALARLSEHGLPYVSIMTDPTTGGVTASFAMLGDVNIAEPGALIGFAGPRVIEQTIRQKLPEGFQRAEFLQRHGMLDLVVPRQQLRDTVGRVLRLLWAGPRREALTDETLARDA